MKFLHNIYLIIHPYAFRALSRPFYFNFMLVSGFSKRRAIRILFLGVALCSPVSSVMFWRKQCPPLQLGACCFHSIAARSSETLVGFYWTTRHHIPEETALLPYNFSGQILLQFFFLIHTTCPVYFSTPCHVIQKQNKLRGL